MLIQGDAGASDAIVAGGGVEAIVKLLSGGPVSAGAIAAVSCLGELVAGNRCDNMLTCCDPRPSIAHPTSPLSEALSCSPLWGIYTSTVIPNL